MKKTIIYSVVVALSLVSCSKSADTPESNMGKDTKTVCFAAGSLSKTTVSEEGEVNWVEGDKISVYYVNSSNVAVEKQAVAKVYAGGAAVFEAEIPAADNPDHYYASYPAGKGRLLPASGGFSEAFSLSFGPSDGSFRSANYMAAYCNSENLVFNFKNAGAIVRVQVHEGGRIFRGEKAMTINKVYVESVTGSHSLSSTELPVIVSDGAVSGFGTPAGTVKETASAEKIPSSVLASSYVYVPVLPCELQNGFIVGFEVAGGEIVPAWQSEDKTVNMTRSHIVSVADATERIVWDYYVSPDGTGNGKSADSPMSLETMAGKFVQARQSSGVFRAINGTVFHLEGGKTFDASGGVAFDFAECKNLAISVQGGWKSTEKTVLDGGLTQKFININADSKVSFRDIVFYRGQDHDAGNGGAVYAIGGYLDFRDCDFISNNAGTKVGGAIYISHGGNVSARDCRFIDNSCTGNSGGAIAIAATSNGLCYFTNCIFNSNCSGTYYGCAIHAAKATGFMGVNNCLFYDNNGTKKGATDGPSNLHIAIPHCLINSTFISPVNTYGNVFGLRCGASDSFGSSLLANNIIINENEASGSFVPYAMSTVNTSYWVRSCGYNQYNSYYDNDHILVSDTDNLIACPTLGNKTTLYSYTWDEQSCAWAWDASTKVGDMPDMATLMDLMENDEIDGVKTAISGQVSDFLDWLRAQSYNDGSDNALTVDLYGTHRDEDAIWPGCYQK